MTVTISFNKQSAPWKVLEIYELSALCGEPQKVCSVSTLVAVARASTGGKGIRGIMEKTAILFFNYQIYLILFRSFLKKYFLKNYVRFEPGSIAEFAVVNLSLLLKKQDF